MNTRNILTALLFILGYAATANDGGKPKKSETATITSSTVCAFAKPPSRAT